MIRPFRRAARMRYFALWRLQIVRGRKMGFCDALREDESRRQEPALMLGCDTKPSAAPRQASIC